MQPRFFDIHSHVSFPEFDRDRAEVLARMRKAGVWAITVGVDLKSSKEAVALAEKHDGIFATVGLHPADNRREVLAVEEYRTLLAHPKVVAVGECGLDYLRVSGDVAEDKKRQKEIFEAQIALAVEMKKPLMIHCRDAHEDMLAILTSKKKEHGEDLRGNIHFFTGSIGVARRYFALGFTISFTGVITFTHDYDEAIRYAPADMILSETDCPFVAPVPFRGKRCEPIYVREVVETLARIRGEDIETMASQLVANAAVCFPLQVAPLRAL